MRKKILFVITKSNFGGAQRYVYDIARSISTKEFEVIVAFGGDGYLKKKLIDANIKIVPIDGLERDVNILNEFKVFFRLIKLYKNEQPDVIHLNSSKIGGLGALAGRVLGVPKIVFTAHGWAFNEERSWIEKKIIALLYWFTLILSHTTIAVSKQIKDQVQNFPFAKDKMVVIHNGVDNAGVFSKEEARELLLKNNTKLSSTVSQDTFWIGTISELHKTKGLKYSIEAIKKLVEKMHNIVFIIIGEGEERKTLHELIQKNGLQNKVFMLGFIDTAAQYLRAFDLFTLTSISEALSYTILEAGLSESAVVASNVGGIPEIITSNESGLLVQSRDSNAIANAIEFLMNDKEKRDIFGVNLRQKVDRKFSLEEMLKKTIKVYKN
jgi:glycosyltransferase involved in cell wall biosynthesis